MISPAEQLKKATLNAHRATEQAAPGKKLMRATISPEEYRVFLQANHQLWSFFEEEVHRAAKALAVSSPISWLSDGGAALREEVHSFEPSDRHYLQPIELTLDTPAHWLGTTYVLLGSTRGGRHIYEALLRNEQLRPLGDFPFYRFCAELDLMVWQRFQSQLNATLSTPSLIEEAIEAAHQSFRCFEETYRTAFPTSN